VFVHISAVEKAGLTGLNEGQVVEYEEVPNKEKTSSQASTLILLKAMPRKSLAKYRWTQSSW
jgi:'Cold-shock' DNA-binding domain